MKSSLIWISLLTSGAGFWLGFMETVLKHPGYGERTVVASAIAAEGLATLLLLVLHGHGIFRVLLGAAALGTALLGASAIRGVLAGHFEGFVLIIGVALTVQSLLTLVVILGLRGAH